MSPARTRPVLYSLLIIASAACHHGDERAQSANRNDTEALNTGSDTSSGSEGGGGDEGGADSAAGNAAVVEGDHYGYYIYDPLEVSTACTNLSLVIALYHLDEGFEVIDDTASLDDIFQVNHSGLEEDFNCSLQGDAFACDTASGKSGMNGYGIPAEMDFTVVMSGAFDGDLAHGAHTVELSCIGTEEACLEAAAIAGCPTPLQDTYEATITWTSKRAAD